MTPHRQTAAAYTPRDTCSTPLTRGIQKLRSRLSAPHLRDDAALALQRLYGFGASFQHLSQHLQHTVPHGRGAADEDVATHVLNPCLDRLALLLDGILNVALLLALPWPRESREEAGQRPLWTDLHPGQGCAAPAQLHRGAHLILVKPVLRGIPAPEEEHCRGDLRTLPELVPETAEGCHAGTCSHHNDRHIFAWQGERG
mmetsp:Transcript_41383/g.96628  ORF Transcript_41383/g.96628 Transcript_41383/m.96628 type:complete len:200 (-) Transcript_41383:1464-2063(-)